MADGPVAIVTGSGKKRIGRYVADALAGRGHRLVIHYRTSVAEAEESVAEYRRQNVEAVAIPANLADETQVARLVQQTLERFGRLDVLVHAAAIWRSKPLEQVTAADVRDHFETNTLSTFLCVQHAGLAMAKQSTGGCIVTIGDWAIVRPYLNYAAYFPSKGAIPTLTRCLAVELAERNPRIRVNCVLPGPVMLPPDLPEAERREAIHATLVKREGSPEDIARTVLYLLDSEFVTGTCIPVDGGRTIYAGGL